jgi:signal transduction histidine kinase
VEKLLRGILESYPNLQPPQSKVEVVGDFPVVLANEAALTQILSNLLGNAVKFVAPGVAPEVRVWSEAQGEMVRIHVRDNGIGIAKEYQEAIFGIFRRLNREYEGTGIGLTIAKKAAERMGGSIALESEPGRGSTFTLTLPRAR